MAGILIGGRSRRMGRPKQFLIRTAAPAPSRPSPIGAQNNVEIGDLSSQPKRDPSRSLLLHLIDVLQPHVDGVLLLGSADVPAEAAYLQRLDDVDGLVGPLAGILAGMAAYPHHCWLICACDMPDITADAVAWLLSSRDGGAIATIPYLPNKDSYEPLFALYEARARSTLQRMADRGELKPVVLADSPVSLTPTPPEHLFSAWDNLNTRAELEAHGNVVFPQEDPC